LSKNEIQSGSGSKKTHNFAGSDSKNPDPGQHCSSPARGKFMFFMWQHSPPGPPALRLVLSDRVTLLFDLRQDRRMNSHFLLKIHSTPPFTFHPYLMQIASVNSCLFSAYPIALISKADSQEDAPFFPLLLL